MGNYSVIIFFAHLPIMCSPVQLQRLLVYLGMVEGNSCMPLGWTKEGEEVVCLSGPAQLDEGCSLHTQLTSHWVCIAFARLFFSTGVSCVDPSLTASTARQLLMEKDTRGTDSYSSLSSSEHSFFFPLLHYQMLRYFKLLPSLSLLSEILN